MKVRQRTLNILVALDQFLLCFLSLGYYGPDETLSALAWRWKFKGKRLWVYKSIDFLFAKLEKDHCYKSYIAELDRLQLPDDYR